MEIDELRPCDLCGGKINPFFYKVTIQQFMLDQQAIQQNMGLMNIFGGSIAMTKVFSPARAMEKPMTESHEAILCTTCFLEHLNQLHAKLKFLQPDKEEA